MDAREVVIQAIYLASSVLFILGLKSLSHPDKARLGMQQAAVGMVLAIVGTLFHHEIIRFDFIAVALILGTVIGYPLGMFERWEGTAQQIDLADGDLLALYTDGVTEAVDAEGNDFGAAGLVDALKAGPLAGAQDVLDRVVRAVREFSPKEQQDDITVLVAQVRDES